MSNQPISRFLSDAAGSFSLQQDGEPRDEVVAVSITGSPTGGTFTLTYDGQTTAGIAFDAAASAVQSALEALSNLVAGDVVATGGALPGTDVVITFGGPLSNTNVVDMTADGTNLTGGTTPDAAASVTTQGNVGELQYDLSPAAGEASLEIYQLTFSWRSSVNADSDQTLNEFMDSGASGSGTGIQLAVVEVSDGSNVLDLFGGLKIKRNHQWVRNGWSLLRDYEHGVIDVDFTMTFRLDCIAAFGMPLSIHAGQSLRFINGEDMDAKGSIHLIALGHAVEALTGTPPL